MYKNLVKFKCAFFEIRERANRQTNRQTDTLITILGSPTWGEGKTTHRYLTVSGVGALGVLESLPGLEERLARGGLVAAACVDQTQPGDVHPALQYQRRLAETLQTRRHQTD